MKRFLASVALVLMTFGVAATVSAENEAATGENPELGQALAETFYGTLGALLPEVSEEPSSPPQASEPTPEITETDTHIFITITITTKYGTITITIRINKRTGKTKITVCGIVINEIPIPCLTYWIRPGDGDIVDDLPWPLETKFCTWERQADGSVIFNCDFEYWDLKYKGRIKLWINERGELCRQIDNGAPVCQPLDSVPPEIMELWRRINIPYLPPPPPPPPPCPPQREYLCPGDPDEIYYVDELPAADPGEVDDL